MLGFPFSLFLPIFTDIMPDSFSVWKGGGYVSAKKRWNTTVCLRMDSESTNEGSNQKSGGGTVAREKWIYRE